ncbi:hypothetical protein [Roseomonas populi]|uniref:Uncharacterized protein n=1 Tax=Roseomonas populi TaxID=3121582 RepID=A0ABT1XC99_9PROT|nr:hypothetical protein [Roseomonas pecuniae]MCR0985761.1 hypothetical protein [Roseomonas pecuniae]
MTRPGIPGAVRRERDTAPFASLPGRKAPARTAGKAGVSDKILAAAGRSLGGDAGKAAP